MSSKLQKSLEAMTVAEITKYAKELGLSKTAGKRKTELISYVVEEYAKLPEDKKKLPENKDPEYQKLLSRIERVESSIARLDKLKKSKEEQLAKLYEEKKKYES